MPWYESFDSLIARNLPTLLVKKDEPMAGHTTFRIGGPARLMACPSSGTEAAALLRLLREADAPVELMGKGTNLLVADGGLDAVVVRLGEAISEAGLLPGDRVRAGAGISLAKWWKFFLKLFGIMWLVMMLFVAAAVIMKF